ncbi:MAG: hypothetical protein ACOYY2_02925 [Actinomycetota bacterium]
MTDETPMVEDVRALLRTSAATCSGCRAVLVSGLATTLAAYHMVNLACVNQQANRLALGALAREKEGL